MSELSLKINNDLFLKTFLKMAEIAIPRMKFRIRATEDAIDGYSYFDPIIEHDWQEKYLILFEKPWLYSAWDEPLYVDGTIVTLEIDSWDPRWVKNIREVGDN